MPEKFRGERYIDGCYSNNLPVLDENTITVSPFCGESDICPQDNSYNLFQVNFNNTSIELSPQNLLRILQILFPPQVEVLSDMCKQGFDDALRYLQRNTLVSCVRCIAVNSEVQLEDTLQQFDCDSDSLSDDYDDEYEDDDDNLACDECNQRRMLASVDDFPETVLSVLDEAALSMNSGLISWVFKHKSMRVLSVLTLPYVLPFDIARAVYSRFIDIVPKVGKDISLISNWMLNYLRNFLKRFTADRHLYGAKFSCQLAITEYDFASEERRPVRKRSRSVVAVRSASRRSSFSSRPLSGEWGTCPHRNKRNTPGSRRMSCVNFGFSVDLAGQLSPTNHPLAKALDAGKLESKVVDLANSTVLNWKSPVLEQCEAALDAETVDTFEQVLRVTRQQESIMAYYYLDASHRMQVREIFNASSPECPILPQEELEVMKKLEWDKTFTDLSQQSDEDFYGVADDDDDDDIPQIIVDSNASKAYMSLTGSADEFFDDDDV
uniref:PNPLA domain-containing protein n=1 Tax=Strigamia maritima TaxID=126957 RepID=T1IU96_STRMM